MPSGAPPPMQFAQLKFADQPKTNLGTQMQDLGNNLKKAGIGNLLQPTPPAVVPGAAVHQERPREVSAEANFRYPLSSGYCQGPASECRGSSSADLQTLAERIALEEVRLKACSSPIRVLASFPSLPLCVLPYRIEHA